MLSVRTIHNIVAKYRKRNSTSYLLKGDRSKKISDQQLQTLDNEVSVSQCRLARRFGLSQSTFSRRLKKRILFRIHKRRSAPKYKTENQQQRAKSNCLKLYKKTFFRLSTDLR